MEKEKRLLISYVEVSKFNLESDRMVSQEMWA
jgi:hypothetical protein